MRALKTSPSLESIAVAAVLVLAPVVALGAEPPSAPPAAPADAPTLTLYADQMPRGCTDLEFAPDGRLFVTGGSGGGGVLYKVPADGGSAVAEIAMNAKCASHNDNPAERRR